MGYCFLKLFFRFYIYIFLLYLQATVAHLLRLLVNQLKLIKLTLKSLAVAACVAGLFGAWAQVCAFVLLLLLFDWFSVIVKVKTREKQKHRKQSDAVITGSSVAFCQRAAVVWRRRLLRKVTELVSYVS